jgi:hypothetical protein
MAAFDDQGDPEDLGDSTRSTEGAGGGQHESDIGLLLNLGILHRDPVTGIG